MKKIQIKRIYDIPEKSDGVRILIDRLWPRGIKKSETQINFWLKEIAPSHELRKFFAHDKQKWLEFKQRYIEELQRKKDLLNNIIQELNKNDITLLYAAKDQEYNNAIVLKAYLTELYSKA